MARTSVCSYQRGGEGGGQGWKAPLTADSLLTLGMALLILLRGAVKMIAAALEETPLTLR